MSYTYHPNKTREQVLSERPDVRAWKFIDVQSTDGETTKKALRTQRIYRGDVYIIPAAKGPGGVCMVPISYFPLPQ